MGRISARIASIGESATLAVDSKAKKLRSEGHDIIGFGAGEPDFPTPAYIVEAARAACLIPANHKYSPAAGQPALRAAIAAKTKRDSGYEVAAENVIVTNGGKHAVFNTFATLLDPGDEVIIPAPYWVTYPEAVALAGGAPVVVETDAEAGFLATVAQLEAVRTPRSKILLFVSPSNPTGAVYPPEQVEAIGRWAAENGLWVLTDEIYEHLVYGDAQHVSMPVVVPEIADRCVVVNGLAKSYSMTGWRVGWMIGPTDVIKAASNLQSHQTSNVDNIAQAAALAAVSGDLVATSMMREAFDERRRTIHKMLNEIEGVDCFEPAGAFYVFPSFKGALGPKNGTTTLELADNLLAAGVAIVPGEAFGAPGFARLSYALDADSMVEGVNRIAKFLNS